MVKVLLIDEQAVTRAGLKLLLEEHNGFQVVGEAESLSDAKEKISSTAPDVVVIDFAVPNKATKQAIMDFIAAGAPPYSLIVSRCSPDYVAAQLLDLRATGYITKNANSDELITAIQAVANNEQYVSPSIAEQLALRHVGDRDDISFQQLSGRETQIMELILKGCKVQEIADRLEINPKTVNSYRYRIFSKLQAESDVGLILQTLRFGLIDKEDYYQYSTHDKKTTSKV